MWLWSWPLTFWPQIHLWVKCDNLPLILGFLRLFVLDLVADAVHNVVSWREGCILTYQYYVHRMIYWLNLPTSFNQWLMHNWKCSTTTNTSALSVYSIILLWINYKQEHSESTNSTKAEISIESDLGFKSGIIQIRMFTRLLPKCSGFIAFWC